MKQIAEALLQIEAVTLSPTEPYTWSSGLKSPIYCDNRLTLSYPKVRQVIVDGLVKSVNPTDVDVIAGTATAGIPHGALLADRLGLPFIYVRSSAKGHGKGNQIEGRLEAGARVLVIEDLLSTGMSSIDAAKAIRQAGGDVIGIQAIFSYGLPVLQKNLSDADLTATSLTTFSELIEVAESTGVLNRSELDSLRDWQEDPRAWSDLVTS
ncbi:orotate phosphoribosyltransferase [Exiguobacterium sp. PBE]|uniref:orotate phosphoribosyltransferase n=1 Tax=Exiguobacterium TaxID=33986 RepID=UPI0018DAE083|nr:MULTISPECIES: orotate phosphoribosyltransferase [Exiguobacterium]MCV9898922.1 orotate phosphoribosyltransferase [Exiguobacterium sp. N5]MDT0191226.1 orotate phosphoribosyltransferase [Exiguobacterium sp. BG5(2022)]QPI66688.1 orotate phosphoribosyltransferase [Exiguobacterium sp. PBE]